MDKKVFSVHMLILLLLTAWPAAAVGPLGRGAQSSLTTSSKSLTQQPKLGTVPAAFLDTVYVYSGERGVVSAPSAFADFRKGALPPAGKGWYLKTNVLTYYLLVPNLAIEWEMGKHFSGSLPIYHCGWDWFRMFNKFRVFGVQPELRYFFRDDFSGIFCGLHATMAWYNMALGGDYRYQDHATTSPTFGAGVSVGYRMPISDDDGPMHRWYVEFSAGGGFLPLYYDVFYNVPNGAMAHEGLRKTYWGVDQVSISIVYRFGGRAK